MASPLGEELTPSPYDGVTSLQIIDNRWLLASCWDSQVLLYDISTLSLSNQFRTEGAQLDCCFFDRSCFYSGGLDRCLRWVDTNSSKEKIVGFHENAIKCVQVSTQMNMIITGSWDSTIKLWDPKSRNSCIGTYQQPDKVYTMDLLNETLILGTAGRHVQIYDLRYMDEPQQRRESSLRHQTRCIRIFPNGNGYALSSTEGRVAMEYFDPSLEVQKKKYAFKCHRSNINGVDTVFPVNAISFHQDYGTFATGGCDGIVNTWDGENKKRLFQYPKYPTSIAALQFSENGQYLAVASSYTFEEGEKDAPPDQIFVRKVADSEVRPKAKVQQ